MNPSIVERLVVQESLIWYNGPALWTATVPDTELWYLVYLSNETKEYESWLIAPLTEDTYRKLVQNAIPLYAALNHPELHQAQVVVTADPPLCITVIKVDLDLDVADNRKPTRDVLLRYEPPASGVH